MPLHNQPYESVYGVGLLDDLHNYFPAVLYEPSSFHSVRDLLTYISVRTRRRFDLYSNAMNSYHDTPETDTPETAHASAAHASAAHAPSAQGQRVASNLPRHNFTGSSYAAAAASAVAAASSALNTATNPTVNPTNPLRRNNLQIPATTNVLSALIAGLADMNEVDTNSVYRILLTPPVPRVPTTFMEPVVIRPTQEQITQSTRIGTPNDPTEVCTICQETIEENQPARLILHCEHWFHTSCIDVWFQQDVHCPVCRHDIRSSGIASASTSTSVRRSRSRSTSVQE